MKIVITLTLFFLTVVPHAHAETTIINDVSATTHTGGLTASPGGTITTGDSVSEVTVFTEIDQEVVEDIHEVVTNDDAASIQIYSRISNDSDATFTTTTHIIVENKNVDTSVIVESSEHTNSVPQLAVASTPVERSTYTVLLTFFNWLSSAFLHLFT